MKHARAIEFVIMVLIPTLIINATIGINNDLVMVLVHYALLINDVTHQ